MVRNLSITLPLTLVLWKGYTISQMPRIFFSTNCLMREVCVAHSVLHFSWALAKTNVTEKSVGVDQSICYQTWGGPFGTTAVPRTGSRALKDISMTETINIQHSHSPHAISASWITIKLLKMISIPPNNYHFYQQFVRMLSELVIASSTSRAFGLVK